MLGGMSNRPSTMMGWIPNSPTNKPPSGFNEPAIMDGDGGMRPPGYPPQTGGTTPLPFEDSGPTTFSTKPARIKNPPPTQNNDLGYIGGSPDFDETTGTYRDGRDTPPPGMMGTYNNPIPMSRGNGDSPGRMLGNWGGGFRGFDQQQQNPFMGGERMRNPTAPQFGGQQGGFGQQQMNPFMGGGFGGFGQQQMNPFMGGGFGQQMNPFMGGGGFGGYGGFGQQQMNPFMGGGMGGFGQQQMNPFMGGGGFGGFGGMGGYGQQMQNPFMGGGGFGGFGQQTQNRSMQQQQPMQLPIQQPQQQQQPMGYQGGAF
jgi:hypothetical protein